MNYESWETWKVKKMKKMIDEIINFNIRLEKEMKIWKHLKTYTNEEIITNINKEKINNIFHWLSIEWYQITREQVEWIENWTFQSNLNSDNEENKNDDSKLSLENELIIKSYKRTLEMIIDDYLFNNKEFSKDDLVKVNYYEFIEAYERNEDMKAFEDIY